MVINRDKFENGSFYVHVTLTEKCQSPNEKRNVVTFKRTVY